MARRRVKKRGSSKGRMSKTGELFWMGAGAGLSGIAEQGANMLTKGALTGNLGAGVVGLALHKFSKGIPKKMGQGIMVKAIGDLVENNVAPKLFSVIGGSLNVSGNNSTKDDTVLA
ncbi:MAG: hypothetical protein KKB31_07205 [Nanoarchaeota archaeon]|nr:hypothetical protein [Nanoarchaeota archaeon]